MTSFDYNYQNAIHCNLCNADLCHIRVILHKRKILLSTMACRILVVVTSSWRHHANDVIMQMPYILVRRLLPRFNVHVILEPVVFCPQLILDYSVHNSFICPSYLYGVAIFLKTNKLTISANILRVKWHESIVTRLDSIKFCRTYVN